MDDATTIATWAGSIKLTLEQLGLDSDAIFFEAGIDPELTKSPSNRIPVTRMTVLWQLCVCASEREDFGLLVAKNAFPMTFHSLGLAISSSQTLFHALKILINHSRVVSDIAKLTIVKKIKTIEVMVVLDKQQSPPSYESIDAFLATVSSGPARFMGAELKINAVHLRRPHPVTLQPFVEAFGDVIYFNSPVDAVIVDMNSLTRFVPNYNAEIAEESEKKLREYCLNMANSSYKDKVSSILESQLGAEIKDGCPTIDGIAKELHLTPRTLQNHLKGEGTSYQIILNHVREKLAKKLLTSTHYDIAHISSLLGFASASNFNRAFKQWTNFTVKDYRIQNS